MNKRKLNVDQRQVLWLLIFAVVGLIFTILALLALLNVLPSVFEYLLIPVVVIFIITLIKSKKIKAVKDSDVINSLIKNEVIKKEDLTYIFNSSGSLLKNGTYALNLVDRRLQIINYENDKFQIKEVNYIDIKKCSIEGNKKYTLFIIQLTSNKKYQFEKQMSIYKMKTDQEFRTFFKRLMEVTGQI